MVYAGDVICAACVTRKSVHPKTEVIELLLLLPSSFILLLVTQCLALLLLYCCLLSRCAPTLLL